MNFNPIFVQISNQSETIDLPKQLKLNNPSYLFSDIIKIVNENSIGNIVGHTDSNNSMLSSVQTALQNLLSGLNGTPVKDTSGNQPANLSGDKLQNTELDNIGNAIANLFNSTSNHTTIKNKSIKTEPDQTKKTNDLAGSIFSLLQTNNPLILKLNIDGSDFSVKISKPAENDVSLSDPSSTGLSSANSSSQINSKSSSDKSINDTQNIFPNISQQVSNNQTQIKTTEKSVQELPAISASDKSINDTQNIFSNIFQQVSNNQTQIQMTENSVRELPASVDGKLDLSNYYLTASSGSINKLPNQIVGKNNPNETSAGTAGTETQPVQNILVSVSKDNVSNSGQDIQPTKSLSSKIRNGDWVEISLKNVDNKSTSSSQPSFVGKTQIETNLQVQKNTFQTEDTTLPKTNDKIKSEASLNKAVNYPAKPFSTAYESNNIPNSLPSQSAVSSSQNLNDSTIILNNDQKFNSQNEGQNPKQALNKKELFYSQNISNQNFTQDFTAAVKKESPLQSSLPPDDIMKTVKANDLVGEINRFIQQGNTKSAVIKLDPESLGKVKIVLDVVDKSVHASVEVENDNVKQIVQNNIDQLKQSLNLNGLQLTSVNVSLNNNDEKTNKSLLQKKKSTYSQYARKIEETSSSDVSKSMGYNTYDYLI
ncbi:MAG: flagellar hook-length control protein FliK [Ignavibacteriaceae bacterium]